MQVKYYIFVIILTLDIDLNNCLYLIEQKVKNRRLPSEGEEIIMKPI